MRFIAVAFCCITGLTGSAARADSWTLVAPLPDEKWELGAATAGDGRIYAIAGANQYMPQVTSVYAYDTGADAWTQVASLSALRRHFGTEVGNDGLIYVFSGYHQGYPFFEPSVEVYDPVLNYWSRRGDVPTPRQGQSAATAPDGRIFVMGGTMFGDPIPNVEIYNPTSGTWSRGADMPRPRGDFGCVTGPDGRIYVFGGYAEENGRDGYSQSADVYDPTTDSWAAISDMNIVRYAVAGSIGADGRIYAIGGSVDPRAPTSVEAYDPNTDTWTFVASLNVGRSGFGATLGPDGRIYAIGGEDIYPRLNSVEAYNP